MTKHEYLAGCLACSAWLASSAIAEVSFRGLGDLPGGAQASWACGVSADGLLAVGASTGVTGVQAFRWQEATGVVGFGGSLAGIRRSWAHAASEEGSVIVGMADFVGSTTTQAFRWSSATGLVGLGALSSGIGSESSAWAVSGDGAVIVGTSTSASGEQAYRWTEATGMVGLGAFPHEYPYSEARGVSADGTVVVGWSLDSNGSRPFRWTSTSGMVGLADVAGQLQRGWARAVSADGLVIVGHRTTEDGMEAFWWSEAAGMIGLGDLPGGPFGSVAHAVSADGSVVVGGGNVRYSPIPEDPGTSEAFVWDAANGMRRIHEVLTNEYGLDLSGWTLVTAMGVSGDGRTIVGTGINPLGNEEAWIARIPEPATIALLLLGVSAVPFRRRVERFPSDRRP